MKNCLLCSDATHCLFCAFNFNMHEDGCVDICPDFFFGTANEERSGICQNCLDGCKKCDDDTSCNVCASEFYLKNNNECVSDCNDLFCNQNYKYSFNFYFSLI